MRFIIIIVVMIFGTCTTYGQGLTSIKGIVVDNEGSPIPYCNVSAKGTKVSVTTNQCSEFELIPEQQEFTIVFNCMFTHDFVTFERRINAREIPDEKIILFQLRKHGKIKNKECKKKLDKRLKKITI